MPVPSDPSMEGLPNLEMPFPGVWISRNETRVSEWLGFGVRDFFDGLEAVNPHLIRVRSDIASIASLPDHLERSGQSGDPLPSDVPGIAEELYEGGMMVRVRYMDAPSP